MLQIRKIPKSQIWTLLHRDVIEDILWPSLYDVYEPLYHHNFEINLLGNHTPSSQITYL